MTLKEFKEFLKICRKHGVDEITFGETTVKFGSMPTEKSDEGEIETEELTAEQLIFMATEGI